MFPTDRPLLAPHWKQPHEAWHKKKPDVLISSMLMLSIYVHTQRTRGSHLLPTLRNASSLSYPAGSKGWAVLQHCHKEVCHFRKRSEFDERYFPGIKPTIMKVYTIPTILEHQQMAAVCQI